MITKQTDYKVVLGQTVEELTSMVKEAQQEGWNCKGGFYTFQSLKTIFCQAMVKEEKDEEPCHPPVKPKPTPRSKAKEQTDA